MSEVEAFFRFCPSCGRRFHVRLVSKKLVDSKRETFEKKEVVVGPRALYSSMNAAQGTGFFSPVIVEQDVPVVVDVEDFQYQYKCRHCGHEWTENKIEQSGGR